MSDRLSETICLLLAAVLLLAGCEQSYENGESASTLAPGPESVPVPSGFAAEAIEAAGGLDAWTGAKKLRFDCVVTFYEPDGSFYLTEQRYDVSPWSNGIDISGREPKGEYAWRFLDGRLDVLRSAGQVHELPGTLERRCFAHAILAITTAPARLLDTSVQFDRQDAAVKIQGQWYHRINRAGERSGETVLYQDRDSLLVDMIRVTCAEADKSLTVRGYDYQETEKDGPLVPMRVEIFSTGAGGDLQKRLAKIDCHTAGQAK